MANVHKCDKCDYSSKNKRHRDLHKFSVHSDKKTEKKDNPPNQIFACELCEYSSCYKSKLKRHVSGVHEKVRPHHCPHCSYCSSAKSLLELHVKAVHERTRDQLCSICGFSTSYKRLLQDHIQRKHNNKKDETHGKEGFLTEMSPEESKDGTTMLEGDGRKCHICSKTLSRSRDLKLHMNAVHKKIKDHMCSHCEFSTPYKTALKRHVVKLHKGSQFPKDSLKNNDVKRKEFKIEVSFHPQPSPLTLYGNSSKEPLNHTVRSKSEPVSQNISNDSTCITHEINENVEDCCDDFIDKDISSDSIVMYEDKPSIECLSDDDESITPQVSKDIGKRRRQTKKAVIHLNNELVAKSSVKCSVCPFTSAHKNAMTRHMKTVHERRRDNLCPYCGYSSGVRNNMNQHIKSVHDKVKDLKCDSCEYVTGNRRNLTQHVKVVHLREKSFKCDACSYTAHLRATLNRHVNVVHLKVKNNSCQLCSYKSDRLSRLNLHVERVHGSSSYMKKGLI